ncbi:MAG: hypothetical protein AAF634_16625 [Bacteroidota bacterium]
MVYLVCHGIVAPRTGGGGVKLPLDKKVMSSLPEKSPESSYETRRSGISEFESLSGSFSKSLDSTTNSDRVDSSEQEIIIRSKTEAIFRSIPDVMMVLILGFDI